MERRSVVTAFLEHQGKILLVRRSGRVGSYPGLWSGISGHLEGEPLDHIWVELREETGLLPTDLILRRQAPPLEVSDPLQGVIWVVHPFLLTVEQPDKIRLDWENSELQWIFPTELAQFSTVPALAAALDACLRG